LFIPAFVRTFAAWIIEAFLGDKIFAETLRVTKSKSVSSYWKLIAAKDEYIRHFNETIWEKHEFDSIIAPVQALPQLPHG